MAYNSFASQTVGERDFTMITGHCVFPIGGHSKTRSLEFLQCFSLACACAVRERRIPTVLPWYEAWQEDITNLKDYSADRSQISISQSVIQSRRLLPSGQSKGNVLIVNTVYPLWQLPLAKTIIPEPKCHDDGVRNIYNYITLSPLHVLPAVQLLH